MSRVRMLWEDLKARSAKLRQSADELKSKAEVRSASLPELALAAQENQPGGAKAFSDAVDEVDRLIAQARQAQFAAIALDEKAEQTRLADIQYERNARVDEMASDRAAYDHAVNEVDAALKNLEDAFVLLNNARNDFVGSLRRAEFGDAATSLQRRAPRFLQMAMWAQAPLLARALGLERKFFHHAKPLSETTDALPSAQPQENAQ
ncbi:MAG: hypothetical protein AB7P97_20870 [Hyphomonadaceae bacterium]